MEATYGEMVGLDSDDVYLEASTHTATEAFWNDQEIINFYKKITDLNHEPEPRIPNSNVDLEANWGMYKHGREDLNLLLTYKIIMENGKKKHDENILNLAEAFLRIMLTLYKRTVEGEDKMSMALFIIHYYEDLYKDCDRESADSNIKDTYDEARKEYMTRGKTTARYLLLKKELDWELIELWKNKERSEGKEFKASLSEARRLYVGLSREMKMLKERIVGVYARAPKYEMVFRMFMILSHDEVRSIHGENTRQFFLDPKVNDIYNELVEEFFHGFQVPEISLSTYVNQYAESISKDIKREWGAANKPPNKLEYYIDLLYYLIFLKTAESKYKNIIEYDVPRSLLERYQNKKQSSNQSANDFDRGLMAYQKLFRLIGPIKPFNFKQKRTKKEEEKYTAWRGGKPGNRPPYEIGSNLYLTQLAEDDSV